MSSFKSKWVRQERKGLLERIGDSLRSEEPLRPRLEKAKKKLSKHIRKLDSIFNRLSRRDSRLFKRVVKAVRRHDVRRANVFANELAEVRKMEKKVTQCKLALEQVALRLETVKELGDVVNMLAPASSVVRNMGPTFGSVVPAGEKAMSEINRALNSMLVDTGQTGGYTLDFKTANMDAEKILEEAEAVAERRMREQFPQIPPELTVSEQMESAKQASTAT